MLGETDLIFKRERAETYIAGTDVYILKFDIEIFNHLMNQF